MEVGELTVMSGKGFTITATVAKLAERHPAVLVPLTEYVAVEEGEKEVPLICPPTHV